MSIRGGKRAVDAIAAGMTHETPAYRALTEAAAFGPDFAEGRAAFAEPSGRQNSPFAARPRRCRRADPPPFRRSTGPHPFARSVSKAP